MTKLSLVASNPAPRKFGKHGAALWQTVQREYAISDVELLVQACVALDRAELLAAQVERDGVTLRTKSGIKSHPCMKDELAARSFVVRTLQRLGLNWENVKSVGRPSTGTGWNGEE